MVKSEIRLKYPGLVVFASNILSDITELFLIIVAFIIQIAFYIKLAAKALLEKIGFEIIYKRNINNFPSPIYYIIPELIHSKILKRLDDMLSRGWLTLIVGRGGGGKHNIS